MHEDKGFEEFVKSQEHLNESSRISLYSNLWAAYNYANPNYFFEKGLQEMNHEHCTGCGCKIENENTSENSSALSFGDEGEPYLFIPLTSDQAILFAHLEGLISLYCKFEMSNLIMEAMKNFATDCLDD